jgi:hypothetical protein
MKKVKELRVLVEKNVGAVDHGLGLGVLEQKGGLENTAEGARKPKRTWWK